MNNLNEIRQIIRNSDAGDKLSKIERWSRFRTDETTAEWLELLGPTAIVLTHQEHFTDFILEWVNTLEPVQLEKILLAGSIHDLGEAVVGDIASPKKTKNNEANEFFQAILLLRSLDLEPFLKSQLEEAYLQVVVGANESLHYLFKALERTEYLDTAIHLFTELRSGQKMTKGYYMIARILAFDLPKIIDYATELQNIVGSYLKENLATIDGMFIESRPAVDDNFKTEYDLAQLKWRTFSATALKKELY